MKKKIGIVIAAVAAVLVAGYLMFFGNVSYEIMVSPPERSHIQEIQRDRSNPVTVCTEEVYIGVLPPYGYEVEFVDVVRDGGIAMLYNLEKMDDPNGEAPSFFIKVSNPLRGPIGAICLNIDVLS